MPAPNCVSMSLRTIKTVNGFCIPIGHKLATGVSEQQASMIMDAATDYAESSSEVCAPHASLTKENVNAEEIAQKTECTNCLRIFRMPKKVSFRQSLVTVGTTVIFSNSFFLLQLNCGHVFCLKCLTVAYQCDYRLVCFICNELTVLGDRGLKGLTNDNTTVAMVAAHYSMPLENEPPSADKLVCYCKMRATMYCSVCGVHMCNICYEKEHQNVQLFKHHKAWNICYGAVCEPHGHFIEYYCDEADCKVTCCCVCIMHYHTHHVKVFVLDEDDKKRHIELKNRRRRMMLQEAALKRQQEGVKVLHLGKGEETE